MDWVVRVARRPSRCAPGRVRATPSMSGAPPTRAARSRRPREGRCPSRPQTVPPSVPGAAQPSQRTALRPTPCGVATMNDDDGVLAPEHWATLIGESVLILAPHIVALSRLEDLVPLIEADHRVMRVYAVPEDGEDRPDVAERVRARGDVLLS